MSYIELDKTHNPVYETPCIDTPFRKNIKIVFADDTATGRPCKYIDDMMKEILPYYANTHSNSSCAIKMSKLIEDTRAYIKKQYKLKENQVILFTGNGATGSINHLVNSIDTEHYKTVNIFISIMEHHSNFLPWRELANRKNNVHLFIINFNKDEEIDFESLDKKLGEIDDCDSLNIISVTACSNVSGIITEVPIISKIINKYNSRHGKNTYLFVDCACLAPYEILKGDYVDGMYISGHKFLGGAPAPGILIAPVELFNKGSPYQPGGGCVITANKSEIKYDKDIERKESAGTPNILGIIRFYYAIKLRDQFIDVIANNERIITKYVHSAFTRLHESNPHFNFLFPNKDITHRLPIMAVYMDNIHFNLIVILLNDLFGIQTRGGYSCCGMFGEYLRKYNIGGWCRITFSWHMTIHDIKYIISAMTFIAKYGEKFKKYYTYDEKENIWVFNNKPFDIETKELLNVSDRNIINKQEDFSLLKETKNSLSVKPFGTVLM